MTPCNIRETPRVCVGRLHKFWLSLPAGMTSGECSSRREIVLTSTAIEGKRHGLSDRVSHRVTNKDLLVHRLPGYAADPDLRKEPCERLSQKPGR